MKWPRTFFSRFRQSGRLSQAALDKKRDELARKIPTPTFWLFGKTGSGKSSVVKLLTGATDIQIGNGFRPTTKQTDLYEFPDPETPIMRFLDTRGLGEPGYTAGEDIGQFTAQAHAIIVTQRLLDFAAECIIEPLKVIRKSSPDRPILLALTCLHQAYPQAQHPPYPFGSELLPVGLDESVRRAIAGQQTVFGGMVDAIVPIDLTQPEDGFVPPDYGGRQLVDTLIDVLPSAYRTSLRSMTELLADLKDLHQRAAMPYVHGTASLAAAAALTPIPWIDIPVVAGLQTRMVYAIARVYHQQGAAKQLLELLTAAGIGFAARMGVRELTKIIPYVGTIAGGVLGAALGYSYTFALGKVCCWYYGALLAGHEPTKSEISKVFHQNWKEAKLRWKSIKQRA